MQVKENVNLANFLLVGNQTGNSAPKSQEGDSTADFAGLLMNAQNNADFRMNVSKQRTAQVKEQFPDKTSAESYRDKKDISKSSVTRQAEKLSRADDSDVNAARESVSGEQEEQSDKDVSTAMENISILLQSVMEQLQLTGAGLAEKLEEIGMNPADLLTEEGLKELFLYMNSAEAADLIVDESLNMRLQSFLSQLENALQSSNLTDMDIGMFQSEKDIESVVSELMDTLDFTQTSEKNYDEGQFVSENSLKEPEVVVTKQETKAKADDGGSAKQQSEDTSKILETTEVKNAGSLAKEKHTTFENPILQAIQDAVNQVEEAVTVNNQPIKGTDIINQIVEQVRVHMSQDATSLEMQLYPEHLGKIQINVVSKDGIMTARIVAENEAAKQAIENGLTNLKEAMQQQELKVDAIEVMVSTTGFERGDEQQDSATENQASKGHRKLNMSELEEEASKEDAVEAEKMKAVGSSVSYMA